MSISQNKVYRGYVARFDGTNVNNLGDVRIQANAQQVALMALGDIGIGFEATESVAPTVGFSTRDVATTLTLAPPTHATASVHGLTVSTLARFQFQEKGVSSTDHMQADSPKGLLLVNDFGCNERDQQALVLNATYHALTDGTNSPLVSAGTSSLTGTPSVAQAFRLGPIVWQGSLLKGVTSSRIQTGFKTSLPPYQGVFPTDITVDEFDFSLDIGLTQLQSLDTLQVGQTYKLTSAVDVYFQALPNGGIPTAFGTAAHIKVSFPTGVFKIDNARAQGTSNATLGVNLRCIDTANGRALKPTITLNSTIVVP